MRPWATSPSSQKRKLRLEIVILSPTEDTYFSPSLWHIRKTLGANPSLPPAPQCRSLPVIFLLWKQCLFTHGETWGECWQWYFTRAWHTHHPAHSTLPNERSLLGASFVPYAALQCTEPAGLGGKALPHMEQDQDSLGHSPWSCPKAAAHGWTVCPLCQWEGAVGDTKEKEVSRRTAVKRAFLPLLFPDLFFFLEKPWSVPMPAFWKECLGGSFSFWLTER